MAKKIAMTLKTIFKHPIAMLLMNRSEKVNWQELIDLWKPDLFSRKPAPAYNVDGEFQGTDLDMHTFLSALVDRGAMINLPEYKAMRGTVLKEGQYLVSKENRHGKCMGLSSNKDVFSFGVRIKDVNVMLSEDAGDFRVFNLMDVTGEWHEGWKSLEFLPNQKENDFIEQWALSNDNKITFKHFISPWRRYTIYSAAYFLTKMAIIRLDDEAKYLSGLIRYMDTQGIKLPEEEKKVWPSSTKVENEKKITVKSVTFDVDIPPLSGEYPMVDMTWDNLKEAIKRRKWLVYTVKPILQYALRGNEFANFKYINGGKEFPHWIQGVQWEEGYTMPPTFTVNTNFIKKFKDPTIISVLKLMENRSYKENELPQFFKEYSKLKELFFGNSEVDLLLQDNVKVTKGRTSYDRLIMFQPDVGKYGVSLLRKTFEKTETVNENFFPTS